MSKIISKTRYRYHLHTRFKFWSSIEYDWEFNFMPRQQLNHLLYDDLMDWCQEYKDIWYKDYLIYKLTI